RWWRGLATLSLLCATVAILAPAPFEPLRTGSPDRVGMGEAEQFRDIAVTPIGDGSKTGMRMAANALVGSLAEAPDRPTVELFTRLGSGDNLAAMLTRSGVSYGESEEAQRLIRATVPGGIAPGSNLSITLGRRSPNGERPVERIAFRAGLDRNVLLSRGLQGLAVTTGKIAVDTTPLRVRGRVGDGLYWALRASGVSPQAAGEYLRALASQIDVGSEVAAEDRFDLIVANRRAATGESREGPLLYAAIDRVAASDIRLMKWTLRGRTQWVDANGAGRQVSSFGWPVSGPITSGFGMRRHPILRFARMHRGIDFGAPSGTPIVAAADGQVYHSGWAGGYGRQVRIAHFGGLATSYSHMSRLVVGHGAFVRAGQLIGYVGSSGLSTGPHLHYEVHRNGAAVNPMSVKFASRSLIEGQELDRFNAHLDRLMAIGAPKGPAA
ncbi:MAG TPA: M23 family metallopeptidase, partial [Sphingomicrobium sp.]|nr:M23 family metallopeptidase [Sphingomicrobium sp.]